MKIGGLQPFTLSDYPGCCAAIIFTIGCNFRCSYCHNKTLWNENVKHVTVEQIFEFLNSRQKQLEGVVITGGEPTVQPNLEKLIQQIKNLRYKVKLDTNGTNPNVLEKLIKNKLIDYIAMDIKAPLSLYQEIVGVQVEISDIQRSIEVIATSGVSHMFRTTWDKKLLTKHNIDTIKSLLHKDSNFVIQECMKSS